LKAFNLLCQNTKSNKMNNTNSIREIVLQNQEAIAIKAISEKIFTLMQNIRNGSADDSYQRRWVWELLQNAMDTTNSERPTKIQININEDTNDLHFLHNGNPFKVENITYLVNQQSSKPRQININERKRTIGKFGTGFITTHLLSEKVTLKSTVDAENLGQKRFELLLDRSGKNEAELFEGVKKSMEILLNLDQLPDVVNYDKEDLNTEFVYHLNDNGMLVAKTGIKDLMASLPFTMAFVRNIDTVKITNYGTYKYIGFEILSSNIFIHNISINDSEFRKILTVESSEDDAIIAIEIKNESEKFQFIELKENTPRLFCNYPFIGTEQMNLPLIFNSSSFNVYQERRNGIILKNAETPDILENKKLIKECNKLLLDLLNFVSDSKFNFENTYVLADCKMPENYEWLYAKWYEDQILNPLKNAILKAKLVETEKHDIIIRKAICGTDERIDFPYHKDENVREEIYDVCNTPSHFSMPLRKNIHKWHKINWWDDSYDLSIKNLANWFSSLKSLQNIKNTIGIDNNFTKWVESFLAILNKEEAVIGIINQNKLPIYPNQNGDLVTKNLIFWDNGDIPEELKNILLNLGIDVRNILLDKDLFIGGGITIDKERNIDVKYVINQIKEQVNKYNSEKMKGGLLSVEIQSTFKDLYIWLCENQSYSDLFGELYKNKETRLLEEETIKLSIENDQKTKAIMNKYGINSIDELEDLLIKKANKKKDTINPENLLISLGITSVADLEKAKEIFVDNNEISEALQHISINDTERLQKVMSMIKRSKENVLQKLSSLPEYDCTNWSETSLTTISGIIKNGKSIELVIRPGDGNQIILFYPKEFDTLENNINELWYDKESEQDIYTFGQFLKRAKISRMPI
jgi:hypothetical protein